MDANGIYDLDQAVRQFIKNKEDWCHSREKSRAFEIALRQHRVKFKKTTTDPKYGGYEAVYTLAK